MPKQNIFAPSLTLLLPLFILLQFCPIHPLTIESFNGLLSSFLQILPQLGYQIKDLTSKDLATFAFETQGWTISGLSGPANSSLCGPNNPVLAGHDTFNNNLELSKTYSALPTHSAVRYQVTFNFVDKFKNPDYCTVMLDSTTVAGSISLKTYNSYLTSNICGGPDSDTTQFMLTGTMPHTANTLNFHLSAKASTGAGSGTLGIRDIQLTFVNDSSITSSTACLRLYDTQLFGLTGECPCVKGSYKNGGSCSACHPSCTDCSGPSASQCFGCTAGYSWDGSQCIQCDSSCSTCSGTDPSQCVTCKSGYWLQPNGSCTATCNLPVPSRQVIGSLQACYQNCAAAHYLLWDGSCSSNCSFPLIASTSGSTLSCNQPCPTEKFLSWNGSCVTGCAAPLVSLNLNGAPVCNKPCQNIEYLYWNNSCIGTCPSPLVASSSAEGVLFCNQPCPTGKFLSWNGSCISGCATPLVSSNLNGALVCNKPCQNTDYLYWNSSCIGTCSSPLVASSSAEGVLLCKKPCQNSEYLYWNNSCIATCHSPLVSSTSDGLSVCNKPCQNTDYLYWNSSCIGTCPSPLVASSSAEGVLSCNKPCQNSDFLYWNGSCLAGCVTPLVSSNLNGAPVCNKPCQNTDYLYWNNSCLSTCPSPLVASSSAEGVLLCKKPCQNSEYLYWNNSCIATCHSPLVSSTSNGLSVCNKPCQNNQFLYQNGSCLPTCSSHFVSSNTEGVQTCNQPCPNNKYLYWNNSCLSTCGPPLVQSTDLDGIISCHKPCENADYLYWNNSCLSTCPPPLVVYVGINGVSHCQKPCGANKFLYPNGSCLSACSSPFTQGSWSDVDLCQYPCASSSQFLYPNGSCLTQCQNPLISSTVDGVKKCNSPCASLSDYYYTVNNSCGASCLSPNTVKTVDLIQICSAPLIPIVSTTQPPNSNSDDSLSDEDKKYIDQTQTMTETTGKTTTVGVIASSLLSSRGTNAITLVSLAKMLEYIRYIDVDYPTKLQYMLDSNKKSSISMNFDVELPEKIQEEFPNYPLPGKFGEYDLKSSFILNYSEALFTLAILLVVLGTSMVLAPHLQSVKYLGTLLGKIRDIIKWNFFLIVLCENIESVGVFSSMEFRTTHFNSFVSVFGTLVCCFVNLLILYLIFVVPYIIYSLRRKSYKVLPVTNQPSKPENNKFESCAVLFANFKEKSVWQHSCMFFILIRVYLFYLIIGYLFEYPLTQAILITLMSVLMLGYLSILKPFKNKLELLKNITYESIIAVVNLSVLILTSIEHKNIENQGMKNQLGDVIIIANTIFNIMALLFIIVEVIVRITKAYNLRKTIKEKGWRYWAKIATILFEPEELENSHEKPSMQPEPSAPNKAVVTSKQQRLVEMDSIFDSQILDGKRPNPSSFTRAPSSRSRIFPSQSISSLNGLLPSAKTPMNLSNQGNLSLAHQDSQSRPNSYRTLLSSTQEFELQKGGNESPPNDVNGLFESPRGMRFKKRSISKKRTFIASQDNLVDSSFEGDVKTPKGRSLVLSPRNNLKTSMKSNFKPTS